VGGFSRAANGDQARVCSRGRCWPWSRRRLRSPLRGRWAAWRNCDGVGRRGVWSVRSQGYGVQVRTICVTLSVEDLFTAGLGLDLAGAILLALGLLREPWQIAYLGTWYGPMRQSSAAALDRVRAEFGAAALGFGFGLQTAGCLVVLGGATVHTGRSEVVAGFVIGLGAFGLVMLSYRAFHRARLRRLVVQVACETPWDRGGDDEPGAHPSWLPHLRALVQLGQELDLSPRRDGEFEAEYAERVYGVAEFYEPPPKERGAGA
jgi:hypothetical protein